MIKLKKHFPLFNFNQKQRDDWIKNICSKIPKSSRVLDVGAGTCPYRPFLLHCQYFCQDFKKLKKNHNLNKGNYGNIDYVCDILKIPDTLMKFDYILCTEVLEHVYEPIKVIEKISSLLKPNGTLILTAPLSSGLHQEPFHFYGGFTPYWYKKTLQNNHFEQIKIRPNGSLFSLYSQESLRVCKTLFPNGLEKILYIPLWLLSCIWTLIISLCATNAEKFAKPVKFTAGFHVTAIKKTKNKKS